MMNSYWGNYAGAFVPGVFAGFLTMFILPLVVWSLVWQAIALWKAAKSDSKVWFVVLLLVHTLGILDILYIYVFSKMNATSKKPVKSSKSKK